MSSSVTTPSSSSTTALNSQPSPNPSSSSRAQSEARAAVLASLHSAGQSTSAPYQSRLQALHSTSETLETQQTELQKNTAALSKESKKFSKELDRATKSVNEIGDVQNWAEMMERDLLVLEETVRLVESNGEVEGERLESGGSWWRG